MNNINKPFGRRQQNNRSFKNIQAQENDVPTQIFDEYQTDYTWYQRKYNPN